MNEVFRSPDGIVNEFVIVRSPLYLIVAGLIFLGSEKAVGGGDRGPGYCDKKGTGRCCHQASLSRQHKVHIDENELGRGDQERSLVGILHLAGGPIEKGYRQRDIYKKTDGWRDDRPFGFIGPSDRFEKEYHAREADDARDNKRSKNWFPSELHLELSVRGLVSRHSQ